MRAIIPVAGMGTRLKPHTYSTPKVLLNVGGKPILGHIIDKLLAVNINKATFVIGHLGDMIHDYVKDEYPKMSTDFVEQESMEGLGHAIYTAVPTFDDDEIFIILGDTIFDVDLHNVFNHEHPALGVKEIKDPRRFGIAVVENGYITKLVEKPKEPVSNLALVGLYYFSNSSKLVDALNELITKNIRTKGELQLTDAIQLMIEKGEKISTFPVEGWFDCGKPETLLATNKYLLDKKGYHKEYKNCVINEPVFIAESVEIENSVIGPYATIDKNSKISECIIKNSIVGANSSVEKSLLDNSIIGDNAGVKGAFKRLNSGDSSEIEYF